METYRFLSEFTFKSVPLTEYIQIELEKVTAGKLILEEFKAANPELAAAEELKKADKHNKEGHRDSVARIMVTDVDMSEQAPAQTPPIKKVLKNPDGPVGP